MEGHFVMFLSTVKYSSGTRGKIDARATPIVQLGSELSYAFPSWPEIEMRTLPLSSPV